MQKKPLVIFSTGILLIVGVGGILLGFSDHQKHTSPSLSRSVASVQDHPPAKPLSLTQRAHSLQPSLSRKYFTVPVINATGKSMTLSVKDHPLVFVSDWDTSILSQLATIQPQQNPPDIIVTWPSLGESIQTSVRKVEMISKNLGLKNPIYSLISSKPHQWVTGLPDTYVLDSKGNVVEIPGPLPKNEVKDWAQVFSKKWMG